MFEHMFESVKRAAREAGWQLRHAAPAVRDALRRLPPPARSTGTLGTLIDDLHAKLTAGR